MGSWLNAAESVTHQKDAYQGHGCLLLSLGGQDHCAPLDTTQQRQDSPAEADPYLMDAVCECWVPAPAKHGSLSGICWYELSSQVGDKQQK